MKMKKQNLLIILLILLSRIGFSQNQSNFCSESVAFCTGELYSYVGTANFGIWAEEGPDYGCLTIQPNPSWFHWRAGTSGSMELTIWTEPHAELDMICYGPFDDPHDPCPDGLTADKILDCNYDFDGDENVVVNIPNVEAGQYYILCITHWDIFENMVFFSQTGGTASTDCDIVAPQIVSNDPVCSGEDLALQTGSYENATYQWLGPNGYSSTNQNIVVENISEADAGEYALVVTRDGVQLDTVIREVVVRTAAQVDAGEQLVECFDDHYDILDASAADYDEITWYTNGTGTFSDIHSINPTYFPSEMDRTNGVVTLTLRAQSNNDCDDVSDSRMLMLRREVYPNYFYTSACAETPMQFTVDTLITDIGRTISYDWNFGDGTFSNEMNPVHTFSNSGEYEVTLTVRDTLFVEHSETKFIGVEALPFAFFSYDQPVCSGSSIVFHDQSNTPDGYITSWHWDFGDGTDTVFYFPDQPEFITHQYPYDLTYTVTLTVQTAQGCVDDYSQNIAIQPSPIALFSYNDTCQNMDVSFTSTSVENGGGEIVSYFWNFGDPESGVSNTAEGANVGHVFATPGTYTVSHVVTNALACSDTISQNITILEQPPVDFNYEANCQDMPVSFSIDADVTNVAELALWHWDFGDGEESYEQNPTHIYAAAGTYEVTLSIENASGCASKVVHAVEIGDVPSAQFNFSSPTCFGQDVDFVYISNQGAEHIVTWTWDWGNGETTVVDFPNDPNISVNYDQPGTYEVTLHVVDASGCEASYSSQVIISPNPVSNFSFDATCQGNQVQFTSLVQGNGAGSITAYAWDFGDPVSGIDNVSDVENPAHLFAEAGDYDVSLTVTAVNGCSHTKDTVVSVDAAPDVDFSFEAACLGDATLFNSSDFVDVAQVGQWSWDFGDGFSSNNPDPEHVYLVSGSYDVVLTVTDINGCSASATHTIEVLSRPTAAFVFAGDACQGGEIAFDDQSLADEVIVQWSWDFGDGTTEIVDYPSNPDISHAYEQSGMFDVTLSLITESGCQASYSQTLTINAVPDAQISFTPACLNEAYAFEGSAVLNGGAGMGEWLWDFGDPLSGLANTSSLQNPTHTYTESGEYNVSLVAFNNDGCSDTAFVDIVVGELPIVEMELSTPACLGDAVMVQPAETVDMGAVAFIEWDLGDGTVVIADFVDHVYTESGTFMVTMTLTDTTSCVVRVEHELEVFPMPTVQFAASQTCEANETQFTDYSFVEGGETIIEWLWNFGDPNVGNPDENISTNQNPVHRYSQSGNYPVWLRVTTLSGCVDSVMMNVEISASPVAGFSHDVYNCELGKVTFRDTTQMSGYPISSWEWTFQEGYYSNEQNPFHIFDQVDQSYDVQLIVNDLNGCADTVVNTIYVPESFAVDFHYTASCEGDRMYFSDTLLAPPGDSIIKWEWDFGDPQSGINNTSLNQSPSHEYLNPGNYVVTLRATDVHYCVSSVSKTIEVFGLPNAQFSYDQPPCSDEVYFTDLSSVSVAQISSWTWDFGDGSPEVVLTEAQTEPIAHAYQTEGEYLVSLSVVDLNACEHRFEMTVTVQSCIQALFDVSTTTICAREGLLITDRSVPYTQINQWEWNFGDGDQLFMDQSNYTNTISHAYDTSGVYKLSLVVSGVHQLVAYTDTLEMNIEVLSTPVAAIVHDSVCLGMRSYFRDVSTDEDSEIVSRSWYLGYPDIDESTSDTISWIYADYGMYDVRLYVENENGCSDTALITTRVWANPRADFMRDTSCITKPTFFYDLSENVEHDQLMSNWYWDFGDTFIDWDISTQQDPYWVYDSIDMHTVFFKVTDNHGCSDTISKTISTYTIPDAKFSYEENFDNTQGHVMLTNESVNAESFTWKFNNIITNAHDTLMILGDDGSYPVLLIANNSFGCADTMTVVYEMLFKTLFVPNAFAPNSPIEDLRLFKPVGRNLAEYRMQIFDLRGHKLFETTQLDEEGRPLDGWDGISYGIEMPEGVYIYRISGVFEDGTIYNGTVVGDYKGAQGSNQGTFMLIR